jgi:hypothetical protein
VVSSSFLAVSLAEHPSSHSAFQVGMLPVSGLARTIEAGHQTLLDSYQFSMLLSLHSTSTVCLKSSLNFSFYLSVTSSTQSLRALCYQLSLHLIC